jgi:hypothetical protein
MTNLAIVLQLPADEAAALTKLVNRLDYDTVNRFASLCTTYDSRAEGDTMWSAVCMLRRDLATYRVNRKREESR